MKHLSNQFIKIYLHIVQLWLLLNSWLTNKVIILKPLCVPVIRYNINTIKIENEKFVLCLIGSVFYLIYFIVIRF